MSTKADPVSEMKRASYYNPVIFSWIQFHLHSVTADFVQMQRYRNPNIDSNASLMNNEVIRDAWRGIRLKMEPILNLDNSDTDFYDKRWGWVMK